MTTITELVMNLIASVRLPLPLWKNQRQLQSHNRLGSNDIVPSYSPPPFQFLLRGNVINTHPEG